jgi:hypothetical protein
MNEERSTTAPASGGHFRILAGLAIGILLGLVAHAVQSSGDSGKELVTSVIGFTEPVG